MAAQCARSVRRRNFREKRSGVGIDGQRAQAPVKLCAGARIGGAINQRIGAGRNARIGANVGEVPAAFGCRGYAGEERLPGNEIAAPFLGEEEESFLLVRIVVIRDEDRTADGVAEVVLLELRLGVCRIEEVASVENIVAAEVVDVAVELVGAGLGFDFDGAGSVASVLRAVVRGEDFDFGDGVDAGIDVQRGVAAVVHVVAAVELPVVVFRAAAVEAERHAAVDADLPFILAGLVADAGNDSGELNEVAAVQLKLSDLRAGDSTAELRGLRVDLRDVLALDDHLFGDCADDERDIHSRFLRDLQHDVLGFVLLEALRGDLEVIGAARESRHDVEAVGVGYRGAIDAATEIGDGNFRADDRRSALVQHRAADRAGVLRGRGDRKAQYRGKAEQARVQKKRATRAEFAGRPSKFLKLVNTLKPPEAFANAAADKLR